MKINIETNLHNAGFPSNESNSILPAESDRCEDVLIFKNRVGTNLSACEILRSEARNVPCGLGVSYIGSFELFSLFCN